MFHDCNHVSETRQKEKRNSIENQRVIDNHLQQQQKKILRARENAKNQNSNKKTSERKRLQTCREFLFSFSFSFVFWRC